jgi:beta-1,4-N-acetylglucosaminyltransferase
MQLLAARGYTRLVMQVGRGKARPQLIDHAGIQVEFYKFKPSLEPDIAAAALVLSHAGAGTCIEVCAATEHVWI